MPKRTKTASPVSPVRLASWSVNTDQSITLLGQSRNKTAFYGCAAGAGSRLNVLKRSTDGGASWSVIQTFGTELDIQGLLELPNGEILLGGSPYGALPGAIYKSTGWAANNATAGFAKKLDLLSGMVNDYSLTPQCMGTNGVVLAGEGGAQTSASGDQTGKARRLWLSQDFGNTWAMILDIYASAFLAFKGGAGLHLHGCCYDESWNRIWLVFGDNTGDGGKVSGYPAGCQIYYSDDRGATWTIMPGMASLEAQGVIAQYTAVRATHKAVMLLPDATYTQGITVLPKMGHKTLGKELFGPSAYGRGVGRAFRSTVDAFAPIFDGYSDSVAMDHTVNVSPDGGLTWYEFWRESDLTARPIIAGGVHTVLGPDTAGRIVAKYEGYGLLAGTLA